MEFELSEEQRMWQQAIHDFCEQEVSPRARHVDETGEFNWEAVHKMGPLGLLGLNIPEAFGGPSVDAISAAIAIEELARACGSTALAIAAHNSLGCGPLVLFGTQAQKQRWLPRLARGEGRLAALALTESGAGSDLMGGVRTRAWREGAGWLIRGSKMWCTNASVADLIITLVRTDPGGGSHSLSLILVPTEAEGLTIGPAEKKMGLRGSPTHAVTYEDVRVPADFLLGEEGHGLQMALAVLDGGRIGIGALAVGLAQAASSRPSGTPKNGMHSESRSVPIKRSSGCSPTRPLKLKPPEEWSIARPGSSKLANHSPCRRPWPSCSQRKWPNVSVGMRSRCTEATDTRPSTRWSASTEMRA